MALNLVIFDMDGVILDSEPLHELAERDALSDYGIQADKELPNFVGLSSHETYVALTKYFGFHADPNEISIKHFEHALERVRTSGIQTTDGLVELMDLLDQTGVPYRVASSSLRFFVEGVLRHFGLFDRVKGVLCGDDVRDPKPAPEIYERTLELAGVCAADAIAIEDSTAGVQAAVAAGIRCIGYRSPSSKGQNLSPAWRIVDSFREIPALLR